MTVMLTQGDGEFVTGGVNLKYVAFFALSVSCKSRDFGSNMKYSPFVSNTYASPNALNLVLAYRYVLPDCKKHTNANIIR